MKQNNEKSIAADKTSNMDKKNNKAIKMKNSNQTRNTSHILINSVAGAAIGAAIGGMTGVALTNKKSRVVVKDIVKRLAHYTIEVVDTINIDTEE